MTIDTASGCSGTNVVWPTRGLGPPARCRRTRSVAAEREVLGHSSVTVTERYSHLKAELFSDRDRGLMAVDLAPGKVVSKARAAGGGSE